jgi:transcriptional regulator with XRE-family HTH domain
MKKSWKEVGTYIRNERMQAKLSLQEAAQAAGVSEIYLGEVERGHRDPILDEHLVRISEAIPGITFDDLKNHKFQSEEELGMKAYYAYGHSIEWKSGDQPMPDWDELPLKLRQAWACAAHADVDPIQRSLKIYRIVVIIFSCIYLIELILLLRG